MVIPSIKEGAMVDHSDQIMAIEVSHEKVVSTFSVGYAVVQTPDESFFNIMKQADASVYEDKTRMKDYGQACRG
jgi:PleD family two-component response regulator